MQAATQELVGRVVSVLINPLIALVFAGGMIVFMFGVVEFIWGLSTDIGTGKERGKQHMLWGIVGMTIMASAYGILQVIANTVCGGLSGCQLR